MSSFWIRFSLASILVVCSSSFGHFTGYGQHGPHQHKYQTDFTSYHGVDQVGQHSHEAHYHNYQDHHYNAEEYHGGHANHEYGYEDHAAYSYPYYAYGYSVHGYNPYGGPGPRYGKSEARDGINTKGEYSVDLPDGRTQIVTYTVRGDEGYVAKVSYVPTELKK